MVLRVANKPQLSFVPYRDLEGLPFLSYEEMACHSLSDSMVIYAKDKLENQYTTLHLYQFSKSPAALIKLLYHTQFGRAPKIIRHNSLAPLDCISKNECAMNLYPLQDMLLTEYSTRIDVASWRHAVTGKLFVFLLLMVRKKISEDPAILKLHKWLAHVARIAEELAADFAGAYRTITVQGGIFVGLNRRYYLDLTLIDELIDFLIRANQLKMFKQNRIRPLTDTPLRIELNSQPAQSIHA